MERMSPKCSAMTPVSRCRDAGAGCRVDEDPGFFSRHKLYSRCDQTRTSGGHAAAAAPMAKSLAKSRIDKTRISAITDEIATSPEDAIAFAKQYGLKWLEVRNVPSEKANRGSREYAALGEAELKAAASAFAAAG